MSSQNRKIVRLRNKITGVSGVYLRHFNGYYGRSIVIRTDDGREYYALEGEFEEV